MKGYRLKELLFMALCCDLGLLAKRLIAPAANGITELLRIPGGIATSFSLLFLVVAAAMVGRRGCGALMGAVQGALALLLGRVGSMGALAPIGYLLPGLAIDAALWLFRRRGAAWESGAMASSVAGSVCACLTANAIVFHLWGLSLGVYVSLAATSGGVCGLLALALVKRLRPVLKFEGGV